jgi:microsomal dipeptidase-like Zn-dependent dipeptidase
MTEPTTEAGRRHLADDITAYEGEYNEVSAEVRADMATSIADIEAEARADAVAAWLASEDAERLFDDAARMERASRAGNVGYDAGQFIRHRILAALRENPDD